MKNKGGQQDGDRWVVVSHCGNQYFFSFWTCSFNVKIVFPFPLSIGQLNGDFVCNREKTEWQWPISGVHCLTMEKSALTGEDGGGGVHARPLLLHLPLRTKLQCTLKLREKIHFPYFYSTLYTCTVHSVSEPVPNRFISLIMPIPGFRTVNDALHSDQW